MSLPLRDDFPGSSSLLPLHLEPVAELERKQVYSEMESAAAGRRVALGRCPVLWLRAAEGSEQPAASRPRALGEGEARWGPGPTRP